MDNNIEKLIKDIKLELLAIEVGNLDYKKQKSATKITIQYLSDLLSILEDLQK